jgi:hypothetical protein
VVFFIVTHNHYRSQQRDGESHKRSTIQQILQSLLFKEVTWREEQIVESHSETFHWVFDDKATPFKRWLSNSSTDADVFWIGGKAGSGKSTLMKFLADHPKTHEILQEWAGTRQLILIKHFFWSSGPSMQQSQLGLMQNLLYQILQQCPKLAPFASPQRWDAISSDMAVKAWNRKELTLAIQNIMKQNSLEVNFCFFVDGLDEYTDEDAGDHHRLIQDLDTLTQSAQVKLCVSSRPWNVFEDRYNTQQTPKIIIQNHTQLDIYNYARETLANDERFCRLVNVEPQAYDLISAIRDRADGVFLWVFLVVRSLLRGLTDYDDTIELHHRLREMPPDLDCYFRKTLDNIEPVYRPHAMRALQFLAETGNLPLMFIHCISKEVSDSRYGLGAQIRPMTKAELEKARDKARSCVNKWCRDLVEIEAIEWDDEYQAGQVLVSHRTVRDFLLTREMQKVFLKYPICQSSHLKGLCMAYLALAKMWSRDSIEYIGEYVMEWAKTCEDRESMTPLEILDDLPLDSRVVLQLAVYANLTLYLGQRLDRDPSCRFDIWEASLPNQVHINGNSRHSHGLQATMRIVSMLMAKGFDPNDIRDTTARNDSLHNKTVWQQFLESSSGNFYPGKASIAHFLLLWGADPDVKAMGSDGCLYDVRQCLLDSDWYRSTNDKPGCERQFDDWLAKARARKAAKSLKALEDMKDQNDSTTASLEPWSLTPSIIFICAVILAIYTDSILWFAFPFINALGFWAWLQ